MSGAVTLFMVCQVLINVCLLAVLWTYQRRLRMLEHWPSLLLDLWRAMLVEHGERER